jgi:4'-phosphopantetheinyl transferase
MSDFLLPPDEVHLWRAGLDPSPEKLLECRRLLSEDEIERADRLLRDEHRRHFTVARGLLRRLLGGYLQVAPEDLRFAYALGGRPFLMGKFSLPVPDFNLAHSGGTALFAFGMEREVGVDVELLRAGVDEAAIAKRYFHPQEAEALLALPDSERRPEFFRLWTRKEAYLKAGGEGMSGFARRPEDDAKYRLLPIEIGAGWAAALAYSGPPAKLRLLDCVE